MRNLKIRQLLAALSFLLITACGPEVIYEEVISFEERGWHKTDTARFTMSIADTSKILDMGLSFLHRENYPYSNVWLFLTIDGPEGIHVLDTLELHLAEADGRWLGRRKGDMYDISAMYRHNFKMAQEGEYQFSIVHGMRRELLPGIKSLEFWVQVAK